MEEQLVTAGMSSILIRPLFLNFEYGLSADSQVQIREKQSKQLYLENYTFDLKTSNKYAFVFLSR